MSRQLEQWEPLDEIPADRRTVVATDRPAADVVAVAAEILDKHLQRA